MPITPDQPARYPRGVWLGVDVGTVRIGVARSDPSEVLATPLVTLTRDPDGGHDLIELAGLARDYRAVGIVVGDPVTLAGRVGQAAKQARIYADELRQYIPEISVVLVDERLTTVAATRTLSERGVRGRARRAVVDQAAAVVLLQHWLDSRPAEPTAGELPER